MRWSILLIGLFASLCFASESEPSMPSWDGELGLGLTLSSGNSDTKNASATIDLSQERVQWRHTVKFNALYSEDSGTRTAQRYRLAGKSDYKLPENNFLFITGAYEDDDFSAYDYQITLAFGYGWRLIDQEKQLLDIEVGPGFRYSELKAGGEDQEAVLRVAGKYQLDLSATAKFAQELQVEAGPEATISRSVTSLTTAISGALSLRAAFEMKHNSGAPSGTDNLDTLTTLSAVYQF